MTTTPDLNQPRAWKGEPVNPLAHLTPTQIRSAISAYRERCDELRAVAVALLAEDEARVEPLLDYTTHEELAEVVAADEPLREFDRQNTDDLSFLEKIITITEDFQGILVYVFAELTEQGVKTGPFEVEPMLLDLTSAEQWATFDCYRAKGRELRLQLARLVDLYAVANGRPSKADPLEWHSYGPLGNLLDECNLFFTQETFTMSVGWAEKAIELKCRLEEMLKAFSMGAQAN